MRNWPITCNNVSSTITFRSGQLLVQPAVEGFSRHSRFLPSFIDERLQSVNKFKVMSSLSTLRSQHSLSYNNHELYYMGFLCCMAAKHTACCTHFSAQSVYFLWKKIILGAFSKVIIRIAVTIIISIIKYYYDDHYIIVITYPRVQGGGVGDAVLSVWEALRSLRKTWSLPQTHTSIMN